MNSSQRSSVRVLPARPHLGQLKHQAKELLAAFRADDPAASAEVHRYYRGADASPFALHHAQLVLARAYGFDSWPNLKAFVDGGASRIPTIKPIELQTAEGGDVWDTIVAAAAGDLTTLQRLIARNRRLARAEYWYLPVLHFAVREGHIDATRFLLEAGADPERNGLHDRNLIEMARDRSFDAIAALLEGVRDARGRVRSSLRSHDIHRAAARGEIEVLRALLDEDPALANIGCSRSMTPLHHAVLAGNETAVSVLLDAGADIHAWSARDLQAIDFAVFGDNRERSHFHIARLLVARGATYDLTIAAASGDASAVRTLLSADPSCITTARPCGRRPLSAAVQFRHDEIVRLLLDRGASPRWEESNDAPHGVSLHWASRNGNPAIVKLLLDHGADPNEPLESAASPANFAATEEIRTLIQSRGGDSGLYDPSWIRNDDLLKRVAAHPEEHIERIGAAFVMSLEFPELFARLLEVGLRLPSIWTSCQGYLLNPDGLRALLAHGMPPDQMNWQHQTLLHHAAAHDHRECAAILLDAGATIDARDDEYRSTPLAWAARAGKARMVELLLARGAPVALPEDEDWATPLAWAERRGHAEVAATLRAHGAAR